jgi:hypothetical protein
LGHDDSPIASLCRAKRCYLSPDRDDAPPSSPGCWACLDTSWAGPCDIDGDRLCWSCPCRGERRFPSRRAREGPSRSAAGRNARAAGGRPCHRRVAGRRADTLACPSLASTPAVPRPAKTRLRRHGVPRSPSWRHWCPSPTAPRQVPAWAVWRRRWECARCSPPAGASLTRGGPTAEAGERGECDEGQGTRAGPATAAGGMAVAGPEAPNPRPTTDRARRELQARR